MDSIDNMYLFGDKYEEKLYKVVTAKQKSKFIFTGLHGQKKKKVAVMVSIAISAEPSATTPT